MSKYKKLLPVVMILFLLSLLLMTSTVIAQEGIINNDEKPELMLKPLNPQFENSKVSLENKGEYLLKRDGLSVSPQLVLPDLAASFNSGTWLYYSGINKWERLSVSNAHAMAVADITGDGYLNFIASFDSGTWYWDGGWKRLSRSTAKAMVGIDNLLIASFPSGTWEYFDGQWYKLSNSTAHALTFADMVADGYWNFVASFNSGTWYIEWLSDTSWRWVRLTPSTAKALEGYFSEYSQEPWLFASFPSGTWSLRVFENNWFRISTSTAHALAYANMGFGFFDPVLVASFNSGTWRMEFDDVGNWQWARLSRSTARAMQALYWDTEYLSVSALLPLTGVIAEYGENSQAAAILAVDDVNTWLATEGKDWRLRLVIDDTEANTELARQKLQLRSQQGIEFFIGPMLSAETHSCLGFANDNELLLISPSATDPALAIVSDWLFRFCYDDTYDPVPLPLLGTETYRNHVKNHIQNTLGREPDEFAYNTYDIIWALALSIDEAGYDSEAVKVVLQDIVEAWSEVYGASGLIVLNEAGDRISPY